MTNNEIIVKLISAVQKFSNQELIDVIKEVCDKKDKKLSGNADKLFKLWDNDPWTWGIDRYNDVYRCLEVEIIQRIIKNLIKLT
jgi:hypothetical protein